MYGNSNHIEILTVLLYKILEIDYNDLEVKVLNIKENLDYMKKI